MSPTVSTHNLTRDFKSTRAVNRLSLEIQEGELFGLVGPDGAGKTTTLQLLAGLLEINEGSAIVAGHDLAKEPEAIKPLIGYMAQQFSLYAELSVLENLVFFADLYDVPKDLVKERIDRLLTFAGLVEFTSRRAAHLSGGMQKKLALACTLIHQPPVLLLDEPTTGVDPISRREFWNILTELHLSGTTILVSTPYMDEADRCSIVGLMYEGRLITCASPENIRSQIKGELIELYPGNIHVAFPIIQSLPGVIEVQTFGESLHILIDPAELNFKELKSELQRYSIPYQGIRIAHPRMEEAFISIIRQQETI